MTGAQHKIVGTGFGIAGAYFVCIGLNDPYGALILPTAIVGSMLPDIDHDRTKIGRKRKVVTDITTKTFNALILGGVGVLAIITLITMLGLKNYGFNSTELLIALGGTVLIIVLKSSVAESKLFKWATKHRGLMHTLIPPALLYLGMGVSEFPLWRYILMGVMIGYCSHLFADMLTVDGCPILFPLTTSSIHILSLITSDYIKDKNGNKKKNNKIWFAAYAVAVIVVIATAMYVHKVDPISAVELIVDTVSSLL